VTHDQVEAMTLGDRLMVMNGGIAEQIGTPIDVYSHPASVFVAGFIGSPAMNFLPARVDPDGRHVLLPGNHSVASSKAAGNGGRSVTAGIRPEHLRQATEADAERVIDGQVELVEALGADTIIHLRMDAEGATLLARLPGTPGLRHGDRIRLAVEEGQLHLFDEQSGRSVAADLR
jgi:sn-glycerol 3-phosphate transport system ATP-binding protein